MKTPLMIAAAILVAGCALGAPLMTPKAATLPKGKAMAKAVVIPPTPKHMVVIVWQSDYQGMTNVETFIDSTTGLYLPAWKEKFHGQTNTCTLDATNSAEFFRAGNRFIGAP